MRHGNAKPHIRTAVLILAAAVLSACSEKPAPGPAQKQPSVIEPQLHALERAKGVEQTLQQGTDSQRKTIDEAGR